MRQSETWVIDLTGGNGHVEVVRTAKPSTRSNGKSKAVSGRFTPAIAHTGNGTRRRSIASASASRSRSEQTGGGGSGYRLANGAREGSVTSRIASEDSERPNMSEFPPIATTRTTSGRSRRSSKSSGASALPKGAMVAYEKPTLLSVDGPPTEAEAGGATKRTFTSPAPNTASSGNSRRSHSGQSQGTTGTGNNNNNGRASAAAQRMTTDSDKNSLYPTRQRAQKPQSTGAHSAGASVQQGSLKRAKSFGSFPRQLSVPSGSKARSAKQSTGNRQYTYTKQSVPTTRRPERPVQNSHSAENQNGADATTVEVTSDPDVDLEKQDMILRWLTGVDGLAERPPSPEFIHHGSPEQSDTAIHVVYDGD